MHALIQRIWHGFVVVALVATATFVLVRLAPGDPFAAALENARLTPALREQWRAAYGLDGSIGTQFAHWIASLARGDLGFSTSTNQPVSRAIAAALPNTLLLIGTSIVVAFTLGIWLGAVQAAGRGGIVDRCIGSITLIGNAVPDFWLALVMLLVGSYWLRLFPVGGVADLLLPLGASWPVVLLDRVRHLVLPVLTMVILLVAPIARLQRTALLDRLGAEWVRTATAKGVARRTVFRRHAWRTALGPVVTMAGIALPSLFGGAVFIERVFAWPGMGQLAAEAVAARDYHLVVGCVLVGTVMVVIGSMLADHVSAWLDPRLTQDGFEPGQGLA